MNLKDKLLAFDTETTGLSPYGDVKQWGFYPARPFAFSFSDSEFDTEYYRTKVNPMNRRIQWASNSIGNALFVISRLFVT